MPVLTYTGILGPRSVTFGVAGTFTAGEPKEIDDVLAAQLMAKGCFIQSAITKPAKVAEPITEG